VAAVRLLFFSLHGDGAIEIAVLCRQAGIQLDIAGTANDFVRAKSSPAEQIQLRTYGVQAPTDEEIIERILRRRYDGIIVTSPEQVTKLRSWLKKLRRDLPIIIRHGNNNLDEHLKLQVRNLLTPSPRAAARMNGCHTLLKPKLIDWNLVPSPSFEPGRRHGLASYVHAYARSWPGAWNKFMELNRLLAPEEVLNYGLESPHGVVNDQEIMQRCRATVHLKDSGVCCFAVLRSMAVGTPVVMDRQTHERCFFDGVPGIIVKETVNEIASELKRLCSDDTYWQSASRCTYEHARNFTLVTPKVARTFRSFARRARPTTAERAVTACTRMLTSADNKAASFQDRWLQRIFRMQAMLEARVANAVERIRTVDADHGTARLKPVSGVIGGCAVILPEHYVHNALTTWESESIRRLQGWLKATRRPLVIDVGCALGRYSAVALFSNHAAHVVAIDSDLQSVAATRRACAFARRAKQRLICVHGFVSDDPSSSFDYRQQARRTRMRLEQQAISGDHDKTQYARLGSETDNGSVPHHSLDSLFWNRLDQTHVLIKCDVEGAELHVLQGAVMLLQSVRPMLLISVHPQHLPRYGHSVDDIKRILHESRYDVEHLSEDHEQHWFCTPREAN
jgi:FkbM family methyltransferase